MQAAVAALVRERGGSAMLTNVSVGTPRAREVLVRIMASGVCPTDMYGIDGGSGERWPAIFGHEGAGVVEAVGDLVTTLTPGDHVALSFDSCGDCRACLDGHPAYCASFGELNYAPRTGAVTADAEEVTTGWMAQSAWATHVLARESNAVRIDSDVPWAVAAMLGCGVLTGVCTVLNALRPGPNDSLLVVGAGTTGLTAVMAAHHRGVARIIVSDPSPQRRELALELGATEAHDPASVAAAMTTRPCTHAIDTVGTQETLDLALAALAPQGVCASVALKAGGNRVSISQSRLLWGRSLRGVIEGDADIRRDIPTLVALWRAGCLPLEHLITVYPFAQIDTAIADAREGRNIKAVLQMEDAPLSPAAAPRSLLEALRDGTVDESDLALLWRTLPAVTPAEMLGLWRGRGLSPSHPVHAQLDGAQWFGKLFRSEDDIAPIICETEDGTLEVNRELARGGASLRCLEHDGVTTAAMIYDRQPVIDLFTRLGPHAVLGVMTGRGTEVEGRRYHFMLERAHDREAPPDLPPLRK